MAVEDNLKRLEERLTRLESVLAQQSPGSGAGFPPPGGAVVDPAPWGGGGYWGHPRSPWPTPIVDPAPWWGGGWGHYRWPWFTPIVDPAPWPTPIVDPAPWSGGGPVTRPLASFG